MAINGVRRICTFASGASQSSAVFTGSYDHVSFELPTFIALGAAAANVYCLGAANESDTFYKIHEEGVYSAGAGIAPWELPSTAGALIVECTPASRSNWIKIGLGTAATGGYTAYIHMHNSKP